MNWISVKDELPEKDKYVLVWWQCNKTGTAHHYCVSTSCSEYTFAWYKPKEYKSVVWHVRHFSCMSHDSDLGEITHWAPLPKKPEEFNKEKK